MSYRLSIFCLGDLVSLPFLLGEIAKHILCPNRAFSGGYTWERERTMHIAFPDFCDTSFPFCRGKIFKFRQVPADLCGEICVWEIPLFPPNLREEKPSRLQTAHGTLASYSQTHNFIALQDAAVAALDTEGGKAQIWHCEIFLLFSLFGTHGVFAELDNNLVDVSSFLWVRFLGKPLFRAPSRS